MPPLVSILIPAYNAAKWLPATVKSALAQSWPRKEIVIVDDGSQDETHSIAESFASKSVKVLTQPNGGASRARNRALAEAQGDFLQYLDADDLLHPEKIERQLTAAEGDSADPAIVYTSAWAKFHHLVCCAKPQRNELLRDLRPADWLTLHLGKCLWLPNCSWLVARGLAEKAGPWDERLSLDDDGEFFSRVVSRSKLIRFVEDSWCFYRDANPKSLSRSRTKSALESLYLSFDLSANYLLSCERSTRTERACAAAFLYVLSQAEGVDEDLATLCKSRIGHGLGPDAQTLLQQVSAGRRAVHHPWLRALRNARTFIQSSCELLIARALGK